MSMKKVFGGFSVALALLISGCASGNNPALEAPLMEAPSDSPDAVEKTPTPGENEIIAKLPDFNPKTLEVAVGTEVTFSNPDAARHTATAGTVDAPTPDVFKLDLEPKGGEGKHTFSGPGTFPFFCEVHPASMSGTVTVVSAH